VNRFGQPLFLRIMKTIVSVWMGCMIVLWSCKQKTANIPASTNDPIISSMMNNIANYPDSVLLVDRLIDTFTNRGDIANATAWCDSLLLRDEEGNFIYYLVKGDLYRSVKKYPEAIGAYKKYITQKPDEPLVFLTLANTMAEAGDSLTLAVCQDIWYRFPTPETRTGLSYIRGVYHNTIGQFKEARQWLDSTIVYDYAFADAYLEKGYSWFDEGQFAQAIGTFKKLVEISPKNADGWYWLGKTYDTLRQQNDAIKAYQRALLLNPTIAEAEAAITRLQQ
jgi:tetratricopeptide (TPR) repeat protein